MNRPCSGIILLVGEGDFSLSVALNKQLPDVLMVSSALLDQSRIDIHKKALENIEILRSKGMNFVVLKVVSCIPWVPFKRSCNTRDLGFFYVF